MGFSDLEADKSHYNYQSVADQLQQYIEGEEFKGYDPYDTLNSPLPFHWMGKWGKPVAIQVQKRNPLNLRSLIGIKKEHNPKAMGLLLHAYSLKFLKNGDAGTRETMDKLFQWLLDNHSKGFQHYCWGYNFDWASSVKFLPAYSPTIVVSGFIAKGIIAYYQATENRKALEVLKSIGEFVLQDLPHSEDPSGLCFSYSTVEKDCCYNASMLGSELFAFLYQQTGEERYKQFAVRSTDFVVDKQKEDGRWNYSIRLATGVERVQIDFHQGYVIDSLANVIRCIPELEEEYTPYLLKGLDFYRHHQFVANGRSLYRYPAQWPVEIHNQAQGILTFSRMTEKDREYRETAQKIMNYTVRTMRSPQGFFYYKKYPWMTIKTPFMRWSQAWMFLALNEFIIASE
ncbi:MAG: hypothetical protein CMI36_09980 [Owenweeksia sp.]|nr:hypothetical protein [Owenweeksia sp.]MBF99311.1 hypothetical protein [Owenweeksia sp.]HCQ16593.1 hypothetical protein [Cryomorphaceae bacterium]